MTGCECGGGVGQLGGVGEVPADGAQEGARDVHRDGADLRVRQDQPAGRARGVHLGAEPRADPGGRRPVRRGPDARGGQDPVQQREQLRQAGGHAVPHAGLPGRGGECAQGQQHQDVEGGVLRLRRPRRVPAGADVRPEYSGARRRARGPHQLLPEQGLLRGVDRAAGGGAGFGAGAHGHVHRVVHLVLQVQAAKDARAFGALLVSCEGGRGWLRAVLGACPEKLFSKKKLLWI